MPCPPRNPDPSEAALARHPFPLTSGSHSGCFLSPGLRLFWASDTDQRVRVSFGIWLPPLSAVLRVHAQHCACRCFTRFHGWMMIHHTDVAPLCLPTELVGIWVAHAFLTMRLVQKQLWFGIVNAIITTRPKHTFINQNSNHYNQHFCQREISVFTPVG